MISIKPTYEDIVKENTELKIEVAQMKEAIFSLTDELCQTNKVLEEINSDLNDSEEDLQNAQEDIQIILIAMKENKFDLTFVKKLKTVKE